MRILLFLVTAFVFFSCQPSTELKSGKWRGIIEMQGQELPFTLDIEQAGGTYEVFLNNADEHLLLDEVTLYDDSVKMVMHIFDTEIRARIADNTLTGYYYKNFDNTYKLPFRATWNEDYRFEVTGKEPVADFSGKYAVEFISDEGDTTQSVGIFNQADTYIDGTFLTPTGDYRFLEGNVDGNKMYLSAFDGDHTYIFSATKTDSDALAGDYWSGRSLHKTWTARKDENAALPDNEGLTYLKDGYEKIDFRFPDLAGNPVSPGDDTYKDKVIILQIFGTWCPNCMDETKFLVPWYEANQDRGIEIIGLAYERKADFDYASDRVIKMKEKLNVNYDFVIAGTSDNAQASETLPMLNYIMAFPTTIFIGKDGRVRHIKTGFEGPGTGIYHERFKDRFNEIVNELVAETVNDPDA